MIRNLTRAAVAGRRTFTPRPGRPESVQTLRANQRIRRFMFTINNPDEEDKDRFLAFEQLDAQGLKDANLKYGCGQLEQGGNTQTIHIQGYIILRAGRRLNKLKEIAGGEEPERARRPHIDKCFGQHKQCVKYVKKDETRVPASEGGWSFEFGVEPHQGSTLFGKKTRDDRVAIMIDDGKSLEEIEDEEPGYVMRHNACVTKKWSMVNVPEKIDDDVFKLIFCYGPSGSGKTYQAYNYAEAHDMTFFKLMKQEGKTLWLDGYNGTQKVMVVNEMGAGKRFTYERAKEIMDVWAATMPIKGGSVKFNPEVIICTSCIHPRDWYPKVQDKDELQRRIRRWGELWTCSGNDQDMNFEVQKTSMEDFEFAPFVETNQNNNNNLPFNDYGNYNFGT